MAATPDSRWEPARGYILRDREMVLDLWNNARTARMSELYYGTGIKNFTRINFLMDLLVAATAAGSGIAGWAVWQDKIGGALWAFIAGLAALAAVAKPLLGLEQRLRQSARQQTQYRNLLGTMEDLVFDIQQSGSVTAEHRSRYQRIREELRQAQDSDDATFSSKRLKRIQDIVDKEEMPAESLWVPQIGPEPSPA